jgi:hypothetical protein
MVNYVVQAGVGALPEGDRMLYHSLSLGWRRMENQLKISVPVAMREIEVKR